MKQIKKLGLVVVTLLLSATMAFAAKPNIHILATGGTIADHEKISEMEGVKLIGHITKPELGCALITRDGQEFELKAQGWNPLKEETTESEGEKAGE